MSLSKIVGVIATIGTLIGMSSVATGAEKQGKKLEIINKGKLYNDNDVKVIELNGKIFT